MTIEQILMNYFDWTNSEIQKKAKTIEYISHITDEKLVLKKARFYKSEFKLTSEEFIKMLKSHPALLGLSEDSVKQKEGFYKSEFKLTSE